MGKSSSDASTKTTTNYNTTTSTTIGDIGFTGNDAIALETALLQYNIASQNAAYNLINNSITKLSSFNQTNPAPQAPIPSDQTPINSIDWKQIAIYAAIAFTVYQFLR